MNAWKSGFDLSSREEAALKTSTLSGRQGQEADCDQGTSSGDSSRDRPSPWISPFEPLVASPPPPGDEDKHFEKPGKVIGTPEEDAVGFDVQDHEDTCAIRAQEAVIEQFTHEHVDEDKLVQEAQERGWYSPGEGTSIKDVGKLLELHGVPIHRYTEANVIQLAQELAAGHKVILVVNAGELWAGSPELAEMLHAEGDNKPDHAVVVTGIDTRDPNDLRVIVNDPGTGEAERSYPLQQFLNAWKDSDFTMVATRDPVPPTAPEMRFFDYANGLFERVGQAMGIHLPRPNEHALADLPWFGHEDELSKDSGHLHVSPDDAHHDHPAMDHHDRAHTDPLYYATYGEEVKHSHDNAHDEISSLDINEPVSADHDPFEPTQHDIG
jgi:hypothetical protein